MPDIILNINNKIEIFTNTNPKTLIAKNEVY